MGHCPAERRKTRFQILQGVLQEWVYCTKISDVGELKRRIKNEWADLNHAVIESAVGEWHQRLGACIRAGGSDVNKDLTFKDKDQALKDQDKEQTPKDKDKDQTFKDKD